MTSLDKVDAAIVVLAVVEVVVDVVGIGSDADAVQFGDDGVAVVALRLGQR